MYDLLKAICYFTLFFGIVVVKKHDQWLKYVPQYRYDQDPFFVKLHSHASKGFIISNNVQMYRGLNLQVATGKQYFMPRKVVLQGKDNKIDLYCVGDQSIDLKMFFEKRVAEYQKAGVMKSTEKETSPKFSLNEDF